MVWGVCIRVVSARSWQARVGCWHSRRLSRWAAGRASSPRSRWVARYWENCSILAKKHRTGRFGALNFEGFPGRGTCNLSVPGFLQALWPLTQESPPRPQRASLSSRTTPEEQRTVRAAPRRAHRLCMSINPAPSILHGEQGVLDYELDYQAFLFCIHCHVSSSIISEVRQSSDPRSE